VKTAPALQHSTALSPIRVGGMVPLTTTDYPGQLAAVVFCQGCPWQCGYCHNPHLIPSADETDRSWESVRAFLLRRKGLLDAVVFSGGEPTLQAGLESAIHEVKNMGFRVGLHTAGTYPDRLKNVLPLLDWVGMDIKAPFAAYERITHVPGSGAKARESAEYLLASGVAHEFRTTVHPALLSRDDLQTLAQELAAMGARHFVLQTFRPEGCADEALCAQSALGILDDALLRETGARFENFSVRSA
jgi:pyruvate formate lyase activating enzyme